jgi:hypothetical protein
VAKKKERVDKEREESIEKAAKRLKKMFRLDGWILNIVFEHPQLGSKLLSIDEDGTPRTLGGYAEISSEEMEMLIVINADNPKKEDQKTTVHEMSHCLVNVFFGPLLLTLNKEQSKLFKLAEEQVVRIIEDTLMQCGAEETVKKTLAELDEKERREKENENEILSHVSACCGADYEMSEELPDEIKCKGKITVYFAECSNCGKPCQIISPDEYQERLEDDIKNKVSKCCGEAVRIEMSSDFIGDDPDTQEIGTAHYVCTKCNKACQPVSKNKRSGKVAPK